MKLNHVITGAVLAGMFATTAVAQDTSKMAPAMAEPSVSMAPIMAPTFDWTGGYAGVGLGYGNMRISGEDSRSAATGGLFAGYRMDAGSYVLGAEAVVVPGTFGSATLPGGDEVKAGATLLLSAGIPVSADRRTLAHISAGPSIMRTSGAAGSETSTGATVGVGVDHMITDSMMLRGALSYTAINNVGSSNLNTRTMNAAVGVGFKF